MPKATPSKADLPKMPTKVRVVQDAALYAQRKAQYDADLKEYNQAMLEHQAGQRARKDAKVAGKRQARAAAASGEQAGPAGSSSSRTLQGKSPARKQSPTAEHSSSTKRQKKPEPRPTARQLAAGVIPGNYGPFRKHAAFSQPDRAREAKQVAWCEQIAEFAEQAGVLTAPLLYMEGKWCNATAPAAPHPFLTPVVRLPFATGVILMMMTSTRSIWHVIV